MLTMSQIHSIRQLKQNGYRNSEIAKKENVDAKAVRKYLEREDFSPEPPTVTEKASILDPYKGIIHSWLEEDKKHWRKQKHTAQRVFARLIE
jgi:transposase